MTARVVSAAVFIAILLAPDEAAAYRPFKSTDADVVDRGALEIELGALTVERDDGRTGYITPGLILNYGLTGALELVGEFELENPPGDPWQIADPGLFLKAQLKEGALQDRSGLSIAAELGALLPSSKEGENDLGGEAILIASGALSSFTYHVNFGGGGVDRLGSAFWKWGVIGELPVSNELTLAGEIAGEDAASAASEASALLGVRYQPNKSGVVFDMGVRRGRRYSSPPC